MTPGPRPMTALDAGEPRTPYGVVPANCRLILASDNLLDSWGTRTERGERITVEWGEPTPEGWYEPVFTVHSDDVLALDAAWREAEAALPKGWLFHTTGPWAGPEYSATARCLHVDNCHNVMVKASTPAAALLTLAAALRKPVTT